MSTTHVPPTETTDEATKRGLELAKRVGDAYRRSVEHFVSRVAQAGELRDAGDFTIGVAAEGEIACTSAPSMRSFPLLGGTTIRGFDDTSAGIWCHTCGE